MSEIANLNHLLVSYLSGWLSLSDMAEWLAGYNWEEPGEEDVGLLELLSTEVFEGLRPQSEVYEAASRIVARDSPMVYVTWGERMTPSG